jgi:hypothetical protein
MRVKLSRAKKNKFPEKKKVLRILKYSRKTLKKNSKVLQIPSMTSELYTLTHNLLITIIFKLFVINNKLNLKFLFLKYFHGIKNFQSNEQSIFYRKYYERQFF